MIYVYLMLYGVLMLTLALLVDWGMAGLVRTLQGGMVAGGSSLANCPGRAQGLGRLTSLGIMAALLGGFYLWASCFQ